MSLRIHVVHVNVEATVDAPDTAGVFMRRRDPENWRTRFKIDERMKNGEIADTRAIADIT